MCQNAVKFDLSDKKSVGDHSKRVESEKECSWERERGRDTELTGRFVFHALISDPNHSKIYHFFSQNAIEFDFSDQMSVCHPSKRFKSEDDCSGERERGRDTEFAGRFVFHALIFDLNQSKIDNFLIKMQ